MNEIARVVRVRTPPPPEIKAQRGDSGRTVKTMDLSDVSYDCDSVVSDITLDAAFDKARAKSSDRSISEITLEADSNIDETRAKSSDPSFYKNVVFKQQGPPTKRNERLLPQETISKLDGEDFMNGKFKSAFHKEMSEGLIQKELQDRNATLKQTLMEKKLAMEYANRKRDVSNARLEDMPQNSLMDMFTSVNLAVIVPDDENEERSRRRQSSKRPEKTQVGSQEITFDPNDGGMHIPSPNNNGSKSPRDGEKKEKKRRSKSVTSKSRHRKAHDDSRDIVFDPNDNSFVPPPQITDFEAANDDQKKLPKEHSELRPCEIFVTPEELMATEPDPRISDKKRRKPKHRRRSASPKKSTTPSKTESPNDIPSSITVLEDQSFPDLTDIDEEEQAGTDKVKHSSRRRHSTSPVRRSERNDDSPTLRRRRRHSTGRKTTKTKEARHVIGTVARRRRHQREEAPRVTQSEPRRRRVQHTTRRKMKATVAHEPMKMEKSALLPPTGLN